MKNHVIVAVNKSTGAIEHAGTSEEPFSVNPFGTLAETHTFETHEFKNLATEKLIRAREVLDLLQYTPQGLVQKGGANSQKFANLQRKSI